MPRALLKKEKIKQPTPGRDGRTARRHHTAILRRIVYLFFLEEAKKQQQQEKVATLVAKGAGGWQPVEELSEMLGPLLESVVDDAPFALTWQPCLH